MIVKTMLEKIPRKVITALPSTTVHDAMGSLIEHKVSCLPVVDEDGLLIGIISDKDIFKKIYEAEGNYENLTLADLMVTDVIIGQPDDEISYIAGLMKNNWIRHVPIVEGRTLLGLVSQRDIVLTQAESTAVENRYLKLYTEGMSGRDKSGDI
ncbi:MAG: CBS domain-containing protein [Candidatus Zixiibacteriota bacterium]|nr:MAG: CBS domain-containing protein [candidate division Zixibacteria bacterium]